MLSRHILSTVSLYMLITAIIMTNTMHAENRAASKADAIGKAIAQLEMTVQSKLDVIIQLLNDVLYGQSGIAQADEEILGMLSQVTLIQQQELTLIEGLSSNNDNVMDLLDTVTANQASMEAQLVTVEVDTQNIISILGE